MLGMNNEQIMGLIRQVLPILGGIAMTFGWLTSNQVAMATETVMQIAGPGLIVISTVWMLISRTKANQVATVANMPEVKSIHVEPTIEGAKLAAQTPPNVTVAR